MAVLGIIIAVIAVAFGIGVLVGGAATAPLQFYGLTIGGASAAGMFVAGLLTMLVLLLGLWLVQRRSKRYTRRRRERRQLEQRTAAALDRHHHAAEPPKVAVGAARQPDTGEAPVGETTDKPASGKHAKTEPEAPTEDPLQPPLH